MKDLEAATEEIAALKDLLCKFKEDAASSKEQNNIMEDEIKQLKETVHVKGQNVIDLQCEVANRTKDNKESEERAQRLQKQNAALNADKARLEQEKQLALKRNKDMEDEIQKKQDILQKSTAFQDGIISKNKDELSRITRTSMG